MLQLRRLASEADLAKGSREDQVKADILEYKRAMREAAAQKQRAHQRSSTQAAPLQQW